RDFLSALLEHELSCPICLQLYTDPVYLPCGHNYCLACINATDASSGEKSLPHCPECREEYKTLAIKTCLKCEVSLCYFCASDMTFLCASCFIKGTHQNHDVLTIEVAEEEMRRVLQSRSKEVANRLQMTETLLQRAAEDQGTSDAVGDKLMSTAVALMDSMAGLRKIWPGDSRGTAEGADGGQPEHC
uniref:RING-type domain-containing protein n=1 Tax=Hucho hucho TaxID=62062 RepID=A0A4W5PQU2_9TELE